MKKTQIFLCIFVILLCLSGCGGEVSEQTTPSAEVSEDAAFAIHFFDVGQADSALVICDGETMLIDGGNIGDGDDVVASLDALGISELDIIVSTHTDEDHLGGLPDVMEAFEVGTIYADGKPAETKIYQKFCDIADENGLELTDPDPGETVSLGSAEVTFLGPISLVSDPNGNSIVLRIDYGETSFVFTGDATEKEEKEIVEAGMDLSADVLKVSHHGASESSCYLFLREVMPRYAVISVGEGN
ncbi:MAG: MBL fold metallo-hydrolase, partial [Firmicutes bacterium]|nr:MBL fold metallo-hydrolase [Bacillota bacterium]